MANKTPIANYSGTLRELSAGDTVPLTAGGTGATTAAAARTNLGVVAPTTFSVTTTDLDNTTSETDIFKATIPANTWADGGMIIFTLQVEAENNNGGTVNVKGYWGANSVGLISYGITTNANAHYNMVQFRAIRLGTSIYFFGCGNYQVGLTGSAAVQSVIGALCSNSGGNNTLSLSSQSFTSDTVIKCTLQFGTANAANYWHTKQAQCMYTTTWQ